MLYRWSQQMRISTKQKYHLLENKNNKINLLFSIPSYEAMNEIINSKLSLHANKHMNHSSGTLSNINYIYVSDIFFVNCLFMLNVMISQTFTNYTFIIIFK